MVEIGGIGIDFGLFNWLAIVAALVMAMALGSVWYLPPVLGNRWMEALGTTPEAIAERGGAARGYVIAILGAILSVLAMAIVVQLSGVNTLLAGVVLGLMMAVGLVAAPMATMYAFEGRPLKLYLVNAPENVLSLTLMGAILGAWQ